jgi:hypothetical protein
MELPQFLWRQVAKFWLPNDYKKWGKWLRKCAFVELSTFVAVHKQLGQNLVVCSILLRTECKTVLNRLQAAMHLSTLY